MARRRTPGLPAEELLVLAKAMRDTAAKARRDGLVEKAERFFRKAEDYGARGGGRGEAQAPAAVENEATSG
jgi:hypothetical protein